VPSRLLVTEHRLAVVRCEACGRKTQGEFAGSVRSGVQYGPEVKGRVLNLQPYQLLLYGRTLETMRDFFGCRVSAGMVANLVNKCASGLVETELKIKQELRRSPVIHAEETGLRINHRLRHIHVSEHLTPDALYSGSRPWADSYLGDQCATELSRHLRA
jgi:hypothetical protein